MSGPAHRVQSAVEEFGFPQGHLGHLTQQQEEAFKNFKLYCAEKGYYTPADGDKEASHDDPLLLRYLRARRFIVLDAWKQFKDTEDWRKAYQLDQLYETIDVEHYEETRRLYPQWTGRRDRRGIPVYVYEVKHLNAKTMSAYEKSAKDTKTKAATTGTTSPKMLRLFALYENLTRFVMPLCTALTDREFPHTPITQSNNIVDISGVGLKQFWNLRTHMQDASTLATAYYPETLDRIFIIGAPAFFPTVWGWIKKWFDPITTSKIFILSNHDMKETLESFIDPVNIPQKYGGQLDFHFGEFPVLDPALEKLVTWEEGHTDFGQGPMYWVHNKSEHTMHLVAKGSVDEKEREEKICTLKKLLEDEPPVEAIIANGHATAPAEPDPQPASDSVPNPAPESVLLTSPTVPPSPAASTANLNAVHVPLQGREVVAASRPEPTSFVTATDGLQPLSLNEKVGNVSNGSAGPHATSLANLPGPAVGEN